MKVICFALILTLFFIIGNVNAYYDTVTRVINDTTPNTGDLIKIDLVVNIDRGSSYAIDDNPPDFILVDDGNGGNSQKWVIITTPENTTYSYTMRIDNFGKYEFTGEVGFVLEYELENGTIIYNSSIDDILGDRWVNVSTMIYHDTDKNIITTGNIVWKFIKNYISKYIDIEIKQINDTCYYFVTVPSDYFITMYNDFQTMNPNDFRTLYANVDAESTRDIVADMNQIDRMPFGFFSGFSRGKIKKSNQQDTFDPTETNNFTVCGKPKKNKFFEFGFSTTNITVSNTTFNITIDPATQYCLIGCSHEIYIYNKDIVSHNISTENISVEFPSEVFDIEYEIWNNTAYNISIATKYNKTVLYEISHNNCTVIEPPCFTYDENYCGCNETDYNLSYGNDIWWTTFTDYELSPEEEMKIRIRYNKDILSSYGKYNITFNLNNEQYVIDPWWSSNWGNKQAVYVNQTDGALTDFPVVLYNDSNFYNTKSMVDDGKLQSDCDDLRFIDSTETGELYWEYENKSSATYGCNKDKTIIWLKTDIGSSNTTDYVYYNYDIATGTSYEDGTNVFDDYKGVYHFGEETGTITHNSIGTHNGSLVNGYWNSSGKYGYGFSSDGNDDYIDLGSGEGVCSGARNNISIETWIYLYENVPSSDKIIFNHGGGGDNDVLMAILTSGILTWRVYTSTSWQIIDSTAPLSKDEWHHIVGIFSKIDGMYLFIDGKINSSDNTKTSRGTTPSTGYCRMSYTGTYSPLAIFDEFRISDQNFTSAQIKRNYDQTLLGFGTEEVMEDRNPETFFVSPADNNVTVSKTVNFVCKATDDKKLENISFYIDSIGWLNTTNTSPVNNTDTTFTVTLQKGTYTWACGSCDNSSNCNMTGNRTITINITIWWNTSWQYKTPVSLSVSGGSTETYHQVLIDLNSTNVGSNWNWTNECINGNSTRARFLDRTETTEIDFWVKNCSVTDTNMWVWVEIPDSITTTAQNLTYLYYGNPDATGETNGDETFLLYDHFDGDDINTSKWNNHTFHGYKVSGSVLNLTVSDNVIESISTFGNKTALDYRGYHDSSYYNFVGYFDWDNQVEYMTNFRISTNLTYRTNIDTDETTPIGYLNQWKEFTIGRFNSTFYWVDRGAEASFKAHDQTTTTLRPITFAVYSAGYDLKIDYVFVRKFHYPEATFTIGTEESNITLPPSVTVDTVPTQTPIQGEPVKFQIYFTATNSINNNTGICNITGQTEPLVSYQNDSCINISLSNFSCTMVLEFYDDPQDYAINCSINDTENRTGYNDTETFTYNSLTAINISPSYISFPTLNVSDTNIGALNDPMVINNTGNVNITAIDINATNLIGQTDDTIQFVVTANFSVNTVDASEGSLMNNNIYKTVIGASCPKGQNSLENLYYYVEQYPNPLKAQDYASIWAIKGS